MWQMESVLKGWVRKGAGCVWQGEARDVSHYYAFVGSQKLTSIRSHIRLPHTLTLLLLLQLAPQHLFLVFYQLNLKYLKQWRFHPLFPLEISNTLQSCVWLSCLKPFSLTSHLSDPHSLDGEQHFIFFAAIPGLLFGSRPPRASHDKAITSVHVHTTCLPWAISSLTRHQLLKSVVETSTRN